MWDLRKHLRNLSWTPEPPAPPHSRISAPLEAAAAVQWKMEKVTALDSSFQGGQRLFSRSKSLPEGMRCLSSTTAAEVPGDSADPVRIKLLQAPNEGQAFLSGIFSG